jgi:hypothetical protein
VANAAGASLVLPAAGATGVPRNLAAFWVRFTGPVSFPDGALTLGGAAGAVMLAQPVVGDCPDGGAGLCVQVGVADELAPASSYVVGIGDGLEDAAGAPLPAGVVGRFDTAADVDLIPPAISGLTVVPSGPCVLVSFQTDENAEAGVRIEGSDASRAISAGAGRTQFSLAVSIADLPGGSAVAIIATAADRAGNRAESAAVPLTVPLGLLPLAITELLANPAGTEPTQEFVELRNLGEDAVELGGLAIADAKGMDTLPPTTLAAGAYALVVASGFDPASAKDTPPLAGTPLVRVDSRIGSDGLSNGGEAVRLLSADGVVISSYSAAIDVSATAWSGKSVHRVPEGACDQEPSWTRIPSPPTPGWGAP